MDREKQLKDQFQRLIDRCTDLEKETLLRMFSDINMALAKGVSIATIQGRLANALEPDLPKAKPGRGE